MLAEYVLDGGYHLRLGKIYKIDNYYEKDGKLSNKFYLVTNEIGTTHSIEKCCFKLLRDINL